jgi:hypothetical protein
VRKVSGKWLLGSPRRRRKCEVMIEIMKIGILQAWGENGTDL